MNTFLQIVVGGLLQGGVFAMVALGFALVYRVTGVVNLSQGAFCVLGAMAMYFMQVVFHLPVVPAVVAAAVASTAFVTLIGAVSFVPAVASLPNSSVLMLTAGLLTFFEGTVLVVWGSQTYALPPFSGEVPVVVAGLRVPSQGLWLAGSCAVMIGLLWLLLQRTAAGRALRACAENAGAAQLMGIHVPRMMLASLGLAALIGALTGILVAPITSVQFDTAGFFTTSGFIAAVIGGVGSFLGAVGGGLLLGVAEQLAAGYVSSVFANSLALLLLLLVLLFRPAGLFSVGPQRRSDVREEARAHRPLVRFNGRGAVAFSAVLLLALAALPAVPLPPGVLDSLVITLILFIAVLGLDVVMGYGGQVSLGQSGFMAIGGYSASILAVSLDWPPLLAVLAALAVSAGCALVLSLVTMRLRGHYLALATLAFALLVDSLAVGLDDLTGGPSGLVGIPSFSVGAWSFDSTESMYYLVLATVALLVAVLSGGMRRGFGRSLQAVRADQTAAAALGIRVNRMKVAATVISALLGSLAGSLYAFQFHFLAPEMVATPRSFELIAMLVLGGEGTLVGGLFGAAVLTLLPTLFQPFAAYKTLLTGALLVATFRVLPAGLFGSAVNLLARFTVPQRAA